MSEESVFFRLGVRLNENPMKMPLVDDYLKILAEYYTEEQAALGADFPAGPHLARDLAKHFNREEGELTDFLENMADSGLVFVAKTESGESEYSLTPFVPGVWEFQLMRGNDTPHDRKVALMMHEFMESMEGMMAEAMSNPEMIKELMSEPVARTITVEKELPSGVEIFPFEKVTELVNEADSFAASVCYCRHHAFLIDSPCRVKEVPAYSCLSYGKVADFVVDRKFGNRISKQESLEILEATEKAGLVHNTNNFTGDLVFVCNCCGCCCGFLKMLKKYNAKSMLASSNFGLAIDQESCSGCGDCLERCSMEALSLADEVVAVDDDSCIGCGNCVSVCPTETLSMVRRSDTRPPEAGASFGGLGA